MIQIANYIDGALREPVGGEYLDNVDPSTGAVYSKVPDSDERDVALAARAAESAFVEWSRQAAQARSDILLRIADLIDPDTIRRLVAAAMEYLIVAAIASLNLVLVAQAILPLHCQSQTKGGPQDQRLKDQGIEHFRVVDCRTASTGTVSWRCPHLFWPVD